MSKLLLQFLLVGSVFAIVLGGSYPIMLDARRQEQFNHYPDKLTIEESRAQFRYKNAEPHPENIQEYIGAGDELASVLMRRQKFDEAIEIYNKQMQITWGLASNAYNPAYVAANLKLAAAFRDNNNMKTALICYKSMLDLDHKYLPAGDPKIARELNNIGLMHYLTALGLERDKERQPEFQLAIDNFKQALDILNKHEEAKTARAATLWNLYLAERDIGQKAAALDYRKQAQAIDATMNRVCREP